jgi:hypothetical protein
MNFKNNDRIQSNITDISAIYYSNESKEDVLKQEQNVTNRRFSERLRNLSNLFNLKKNYFQTIGDLLFRIIIRK